MSAEISVLVSKTAIPASPFKLRNRINRAVKLGRDATKYYCGRMLGTDLIPHSDGQCGPTNGPQCPNCKGLTISNPPTNNTINQAPLCITAEHIMFIGFNSKYKAGWSCNNASFCGTRGQPRNIIRWCCETCGDDICFKCRPQTVPNPKKLFVECGNCANLIGLHSSDTLSAIESSKWKCDHPDHIGADEFTTIGSDRRYVCVNDKFCNWSICGPCYTSTISLVSQAEGNSIVREDLEQLYTRLGVCGQDGWTPYYAAAKLGHEAALSKMIPWWIDVDSVEKVSLYAAMNDADAGSTPLHAATREGLSTVVKAFISLRADLGIPNKDGLAAIHVAASMGRAIIIKDLLTAGVDVRSLTKDRWTPLHFAVANNHVEVTKDLLKAGADINDNEEDNLRLVNKSSRWDREASDNTLRFSEDNVTCICPPSSEANKGARVQVSGPVSSLSLKIAETSQQDWWISFGVCRSDSAIDGRSNLVGRSEGSWGLVTKFSSSYCVIYHSSTDKPTVTLPYQIVQGDVIVCVLDLNNGIFKIFIDCEGREKLAYTFTDDSLCGNPSNFMYALTFASEQSLQIINPQPTVLPSLLIAVEKGNTDMVNTLIENGANTRIVTADGWTPYYFAAKFAHETILQALIPSWKSDVDPVEKEALYIAVKTTMSTPLHVAARDGLATVVKAFMSVGANVHFAERGGWTPLYWAAKHDHDSVLRLIIPAWENVDANEKVMLQSALKEADAGSTPLHLAAKTGLATVVKAFVSAGADLRHADKDDLPPYYLAAMSGHDSVLLALIPLWAEVDSAEKELFFRAVNDVNAELNPLHVAAREGLIRVVKAFISAGADMLYADKRGFSCLHFSAEAGQCHMVKELISAGCDRGLVGNNGWTPYYLAAKSGHDSVLLALIPMWINIDSAEKEVLYKAMKVADAGLTPLHVAAREGLAAVVKAFISVGADLSNDRREHISVLCEKCSGTVDGPKPAQTWGLGWTCDNPAHVGSNRFLSNDLQNFKLYGCANMVECNWGVCEPCYERLSSRKTGWTALHLAAESGIETVVKDLNDAGVDLNLTTIEDKTALEIAVERGHSCLVKGLISAGADKSRSTKEGIRVIHRSAKYGQTSILQTLIEAGADIDSTTNDGMTALHLAVESGQDTMVSTLLRHGLHIERETKYCWRPLHIAACKNHSNLVRLLIDEKAEIESKGVRYPIQEALSWDSSTSDKDLSLSNEYKSCKRTADGSAAYARVPSLISKFTLRLAELSDTTYWYTIGVCKRNVKVNYFGDKHGTWGVQHKRGNNTVDFRCNDVTSKEIEFTFSKDNVVACTLDLVKGSLLISINKGKVEFLFQNSSLCGSPNDFMYGATLAPNQIATIDSEARLDYGYGWTPLHIAVDHGSLDAVKVLISAGADIKLEPPGGESLILIAVKKGHTDVVKELLSNFNNNSFIDTQELQNLLHNAVFEGHADVLQELLKFGADVANSMPEKLRLLHVACLNGHVNVAIVLLDAGARADTKDEDGKIPLQIIVEKDWYKDDRWRDVVRVLAEKLEVSRSNVHDSDSEDLNTSLKPILKHAAEKCINEWISPLVRQGVRWRDAVFGVADDVLTDFALNHNFLDKAVISASDYDIWVTIAKLTKVESVVEKYLERYPDLGAARDNLNRMVWSIAHPTNAIKIRGVLLYHRRYQLMDDRAEHMSATCFVFKATDEIEVNDKGEYTHRRVALKFMCNLDQFLRELAKRKFNFDKEYVMECIRTHPTMEDSYVDTSSWEKKIDIGDAVPTGRLTKEVAERMYCLVMPLADRNFYVAMKQERFAGSCSDEIKKMFVALLKCVQHIHSHGIVHSDIKPLNIVRQDDKPKLIDFDAASEVGVDNVGFKSSSAYCPPESIAYEEDLGEYVVKSDLRAHPSFDVWSLGCILFQLIHPQVVQLFQAGRDDTLSNDKNFADNLSILYEWSDQVKRKKLSAINDPLGSNLLSRMLMKKPEQRIAIEEILVHPFLTRLQKVELDKPKNLNVDEIDFDESDDTKADNIDDINDDNGETQLHYAAFRCDLQKVERLLRADADPNKQDKNGETPLHRAALVGSEVVTKILLDFGAIISYTDKNGAKPLHLAAAGSKEEHLKVMKLLILKDNEIDKVDKNGLSPLDLAASRGQKNKEVVEVLLDRSNIPSLEALRSLETFLVDAIKDCDHSFLSLLVLKGVAWKSAIVNVTEPVLKKFFKKKPEITGDALMPQCDMVATNFSGVKESVRRYLNAALLKLLQEEKTNSELKTFVESAPALAEDVLLAQHCSVWLTLTNLKDVKDIVQQCLKCYPKLADAKDELGRFVYTLALPENTKVIRSTVLWHGRYRLVNSRPEHLSKTCHVYQAIDEFGRDRNGMLRVALKIMVDEKQYRREKDVRKKRELDQQYIMRCIRYHDCKHSTQETLKVLKDLDPSKGLSKDDAEQLHTIVMPWAERNLYVAMKQEQFSQKSLEEIKTTFSGLVKCVEHLHSKGIIHADLKPLNIVRTESTLKLIDFDAACEIDKDFTGFKSSTAYNPPEAIGFDPLNNHYFITENTLKAKPSFDVWSLGCILYQLVNRKLLPLFQASIDDNLDDSFDNNVNTDNLSILYTWSDAVKAKKLSAIDDRLARNLVSRMLTKDPSKRITLKQLKAHPFMNGSKSSRLVGEGATYDVFLSYRVAANKVEAEYLYNILTQDHNLKVFWDKKSLPDGEEWEAGFMEALAACRVFVCLLSNDGLNNPAKDNQNFAKLTSESRCDNCLLEMSFAVELLPVNLGMIDRIFPVMIGDLDDSLGSRSFSAFEFPKPFENIIVKEVETKLKNHMNELGLGDPILEDHSVQRIWNEISKIQGYLFRGMENEVSDVAQKIFDLVQKVKTQAENERIEAPANPLHESDLEKMESNQFVIDERKSLLVQLRAENDKITFERDTAIEEKIKIAAERDIAIEEKAKITAERDAAIEEKTTIAACRDAAIAEIEVIAACRDVALQRVDELIQMEELLHEKEFKLIDAEATISQLTSYLNLSKLQYRINCPGFRVPIRESASLTANVTGHVSNGQVITVHRAVSQGFLELTGDLQGFLSVNSTKLVLEPVDSLFASNPALSLLVERPIERELPFPASNSRINPLYETMGPRRMSQQLSLRRFSQSN